MSRARRSLGPSPRHALAHSLLATLLADTSYPAAALPPPPSPSPPPQHHLRPFVALATRALSTTSLTATSFLSPASQPPAPLRPIRFQLGPDTPAPAQLTTGTMKLKILLVSLLSAAASAKGVYVEGATADSSGVEAVVAAAKLGGNEAPAANLRRMDQTAELPAAHGRTLRASNWWDDLIAGVNKWRATHGLGPLNWHPRGPLLF